MSATNVYAIVFLLSWVAAAIADATFVTSEQSQLVVDAAHIVVLSIILFVWAWTDADRRGAKLSTAQGICMVLFGIPAVPFYLWRARPAEKRWRWIVKGLTIFVLMVVVAVLGTAIPVHADI